MINHKTTPLSLVIIALLTGCTTSAHPTPVATPSLPIAPPLHTLTPRAMNTPAESGVPRITLEKSVSLAWFYKPPENAPLSSLAENFDFFILTHRDEEERDQLRNIGVNTPIYQYLVLVEVMDPGSCTERPYGNQVAYRTGDFCWIEREHPDWFLRDKNGEIIRKDLDAYMDPGNAEYRQFWLERAQQMQDEFGWDGIFIDNVEASLKKLNRLGAVPAKYRNDAEYQAATEEFLRFLHENYFEPQNVPVFANIIELRDDDIWFRYMQYLDGAMIESFAVDYNNRYLLPNEWIEQIDLSVQTQALGKKVILVAQGNQDDRSRQEFSLGTYLLVNDGNAVFRYTNSDSYEQVWLFDNYTIDIGQPLGLAYRNGIVWKREFEHGSVSVNPISHTTEIILNK